MGQDIVTTPENIEKIDFLLVGSHYSDRPGFYRSLASQFSERGFTAGLITACYEEHQELCKDGIFSICLSQEVKISSSLADKTLKEECSKLENKYNIPSLRDFVFTEMCYYGEPRNYLLRKAVAYFKWAEKFFTEHQIGCVVQKQGGEVHRRVIYRLAKNLGIPVIYFGQSLFPGKMLLHSDEMNQLEDFQFKSWDEIKPEDKEWIEKYITQFKKDKGIFTYSFVWDQEAILVKIIRKFYLYAKEGDWRRLRIAVRKRLNKYLLQIANRVISRMFYSKPRMESPFIYFPFHVPDDSQITIRNPQFYDQEFLARYIARCLPVGYKLYVKEHPGSYLSLREKQLLRKEENIVLCHPKINSHDLIRHAKAVIIINSTVGFEALHYFKPIVVVGNWTFRGIGISFDVNNLFELSKTIKPALTEQPDANLVKAFLVSLKDSCWDGSIYTRDINYGIVVDSLIKKRDKLISSAESKSSVGS